MLNSALEELKKDPDFKILYRLKPGKNYSAPSAANEVIISKVKAVILDVETTGLNSSRDEIIEVALILFEFDPATGRVLTIIRTYESFEEPKKEISKESTAVHGITNEMVKGKKIDDSIVQQFFSEAQFVIAHNAQFDRSFCERRFPTLSDHAWVCSLQDIAWSEFGFRQKSLEWLAYQSGFFYDSHRALMDDYALLEILDLPRGPQSKPCLVQLLERSKMLTYKIYAFNSDYERKDLLKENSYRWQAQNSCWVKDIKTESEMESEIAWLAANIYFDKQMTLGFEEQSAEQRFTERSRKRYKKHF